MDELLNRQAERHKQRAIQLLLSVNGAAKGYPRQVVKHVSTWHSTSQPHLIPKMWRDKVAEIFDELVSPATMEHLDRAVLLYLAGDDTDLRTYVPDRVSVEFGSLLANSPCQKGFEFRSRKFSDPLYLTPAGFLRGFPEVDEDLFLDDEQAERAIAFYRGVPHSFKLDNALYRIGPAVLGKIGGARYERWLREVKGKDYVVPRRSLVESYEIYKTSDRKGLEELYSPTHVFMLIRKFNSQGWPVDKQDWDRIVHPAGLGASQLSAATPPPALEQF